MRITPLSTEGTDHRHPANRPINRGNRLSRTKKKKKTSLQHPLLFLCYRKPRHLHKGHRALRTRQPLGGVPVAPCPEEHASDVPAVPTDERRAHPRKQMLAPRAVFTTGERVGQDTLRPAAQQASSDFPNATALARDATFRLLFRLRAKFLSRSRFYLSIIILFSRHLTVLILINIELYILIIRK